MDDVIEKLQHMARILEELDEELGNDTDAMAAVPYLRDAQKAIREAITVLEEGETDGQADS